MSGVLWVVLLYVVGCPVCLWLMAFSHRKVFTERQLARAGNNRARAGAVPAPIWPVWKERLVFLLRTDQRVFQLRKKDEAPEGGLTNRQVFLITWAAGLLVTVAGYLLGLWWLAAAGVVVFLVDVFVGMRVARPMVDARNAVVQRIFKIAEERLGVEKEKRDDPRQVVRVLEWDQAGVRPRKVEVAVPTTFSSSGEEGFLRLFNQNFGQVSAWVPSGPSGWDYEHGKVTLHAVPPLPELALWDEHYVLAEGIAWSFFPVGIGVEGGVELPNPKTGEIEHVIGFDLAGEQGEVGKKAGLQVSRTIGCSPMCFIGGGTGGGKALALSTPIEVLPS